MNVRRERTIAAAPQVVYRAWLTPEILRTWLSPGSFECARAEVDERVGGRFRIWHTASGEPAGGFEAELLDLEPGKRIVWRWGFVGPEREAGPVFDSLLTVTFAETTDGHTHLTLLHERLEAFVQAIPEGDLQVGIGWDAALDQLATAVKVGGGDHLTPQHDLRPATKVLAALIREVRDDQLTAPTPCGEITVGELLHHISTLSRAFTAAAAKAPLPDGGRPPVPDATQLVRDWRDRLPAALDTLADAWRAPGAWSGETEVGGGTIPAEVAGAAAIDEVLVHGWDLATAIGRPYPGDDPLLADAIAVAHHWAGTVVAQSPEGSPGLFGAPVQIPDDAPLFSRLLGRTGRTPR